MSAPSDNLKVTLLKADAQSVETRDRVQGARVRKGTHSRWNTSEKVSSVARSEKG